MAYSYITHSLSDYAMYVKEINTSSFSHIEILKMWL